MNVREKAKKLIGEMAIPPGSLGLLARQLQRVFECWNDMKAELKPCHIVFAADNGIALEAVVRQPREITFLQASNMVKGFATISCFCKMNNIPYKVVDVGIDNEVPVGYNKKVARGTRNFMHEPAMSKAEFERAFEAGRDMVSMTLKEGYNFLSFGEMGIGNTSTSSAVLHAITGVSPEFIVGYGANMNNPEVIKKKRKVVAEGAKLYKDEFKSTEDVIRCVGGFDIAAMCGAMIECGKNNVPFMLDGFISAVAYACAVMIEPSIKGFGIPSHMSREPGMRFALELGGVKEDDVPIRADLALGEGTGAVLALAMLKTMHYSAWNVTKMKDLTDEIDEAFYENKMNA